MKSNSLFLALAVAGGLFSGLTHAAPVTGTNQLQAIFTTEILPGTCNTQVTDADGPTSTIDFGDLYKNEVGTRTESFNIALTECAGVLTTTVAAQPGAGNTCSGDSYATTGATNTAVEIWETAADSDTQLACQTGNPSNVLTHSFGSKNMNQSYTYPLVARWVVANGKTAADITTGEATSLITFLVTYQ